MGLGLPGHNPGSADRNQVKQAVKNSETDLVEKTMLEDKIRATDWEATNEAIEEQVLVLKSADCFDYQLIYFIIISLIAVLAVCFYHQLFDLINSCLFWLAAVCFD